MANNAEKALKIVEHFNRLGSPLTVSGFAYNKDEFLRVWFDTPAMSIDVRDVYTVFGDKIFIRTEDNGYTMIVEF